MELLIIIVLLVIAAETTYLVARTARTSLYRQYIKPVFVDTSVLIDGRIIPVAQSGFMSSTVLIPRSVVGELQYLADQADHDKRARARHGLDVVNELQQIPGLKIEIFNDSTKAEEGVDNRLLKLAKKYHGSICTIDYNLNKVAQVEGIPVLNVNDLAMNLRMAYLPGEKVMLELTQKGNDSHQAVGHLTDGTMVVVEQASSRVGQKVEIEFIRSLQTAAGKMMFARLVSPAKETAVKSQKSPKISPKDTRSDNRKESSNEPRKQSNHRAAPSRSPQHRPQPQVSNKRRQTSKAREASLVELANRVGE